MTSATPTPARPEMSGAAESRLTARREAAIAALLEVGTAEGAARKIGVSERTVRRWLDDPLFSEAYRRARTDVMTFALGALQHATGDAVRTLRSAMRGRGKAIAVSAARAVLEHASRAAELVDLAERIEALERTGHTEVQR